MYSFDNYLFALLLVLVPIFVYYSYFFKKDFFRGSPFILGLICIVTIILSMSFPMELASGHIYDLRTIPWLLAFFYAGIKMGIIATLVIFFYRFVIGVDDGLLITIFTYFISGISVFFCLEKYKIANVKRKLMISFFLTLFNSLLVISGIVYFYENFNASQLPSFIVYFIFSHIVTIVIVVYIIETLMEKEKNRMKMQEAERIKLIGEMAASVAHEVRNPLTVVKGFIQIFKNEKNITSKQIDSLELMDSELRRAEKIINDYLSLAKTDTTDLEQVDMKEILNSVIEVMESYALLNGVSIDNKIDQSYYITANRSELNQVFLNIIKNGIESIENKGMVTIDCKKMGSRVEVMITDTGKGMSEEQIKRLGSPFYTTKEKGTGLGTLVCFKIIEKLKGDIQVNSKLNSGTTFTITLPLSKNPDTK